jgi:hypothetical protein
LRSVPALHRATSTRCRRGGRRWSVRPCLGGLPRRAPATLRGLPSRVCSPSWRPPRGGLADGVAGHAPRSDRGTRASRPRECSRATVVGRRGQPSRSPCGLWPRVQRVAPQGRPLPAVREFPPPQRRGPQPRGQPIARKGRHGGGLKVAGFDAHGSAVLCGVSSVRPRSFAACRGLTSGSLRLPPRERSVIQPPAVDPV